MTAKKIAVSIIELSVRVIILALAVMAIRRACVWSYDFGFNIFAERSMSVTNGRDVNVTITMDQNAMDIGRTLADKGLINDPLLFYAQEMLSAYHGELKPGQYTLNTAMKPTEMMEVMAAAEEELSSEDEKKSEK